MSGDRFDELLAAVASLAVRLEALETRIATLGDIVARTRADIMARIDRLQDALTVQRDEQVVDQATIMMLRRQIQSLQDRVRALEDKS